MTWRRIVVLVAVLLAGAGVTLRGGEDGRVVVAEFRDARGLVKDADVRVGGAVAGRVASIALDDNGRARVTLRLHDGLPRARADAAAAVRPADLVGDVAVELSLGSTPAPLRGAIPVTRTTSAPRLDELLSTFTAPARAGLQALLVGAGRALSARGDDLARATVELRPALRAATAVTRELGSQNAALGGVVVHADRVAAALASHSPDLDASLRRLDALLAAAAARRGDLDRGLAALPATARRVSATAHLLARTARAATPVAVDLRAAAPRLATAAAELEPFLARVRRAAAPARDTIREARALLGRGAPALAGFAAGLPALQRAAGPLDALLAAVEPAAPMISDGFFVNFADEAAEPGRQPFDPFADPRRNYWRGAGVLTCEAFGVPVGPGCLAKALAQPPRAGAPGGGAAGGGARPALHHVLDLLLGR